MRKINEKIKFWQNYFIFLTSLLCPNTHGAARECVTVTVQRNLGRSQVLLRS